jgi:hypothetical protein
LGNGGEEMVDVELLQILGDQIYSNPSSKNLSESSDKSSVISRFHQQFWNQQLLESSSRGSQDTTSFDLSSFVMDDSEIGMIGTYEIEGQAGVNENVSISHY